MKPITEKPADAVMQFFPRGLYVQLNSESEEVVEAAESAWEEAVSRYESYLDTVRPEMPAHVQKLAEMYLHDAEFLAFTMEAQPSIVASAPTFSVTPWSAIAVMSLEQDGCVRNLAYGLWDTVREHDSLEDWPFSKVRKHWLCDEVIVVPGQACPSFLHRILFSDGEILEIPFLTFVEARFLLVDALKASQSARQTV